MPRSIWTGTISFGLVTVPIKLYSAVNRKTVRFNQLSATTGARIAQQRVDSSTGEQVEYGDIVKGYEIAPDRYVTIEPGELESVQPEKTKAIEIEDFVELADIDPIYYDHPYYLAPGPGGAKPYRLLLEAMRDAGKVGIARVVIRQKESLVAIRPMGEVLGLATMLFADEIVDPDRIDEIPAADEVKTTDKELAIAIQLVDSLAGAFEPAKYRDTYRDAVLEMIERKASGEEVAEAPAPAAEEPGAAPDLMAALKASIEAVQARTGGEGAPAAPAKKKAPAKKPAGKKQPAEKNGAKPRSKA